MDYSFPTAPFEPLLSLDDEWCESTTVTLTGYWPVKTYWAGGVGDWYQISRAEYHFFRLCMSWPLRLFIDCSEVKLAVVEN
jgi:hypothetical protein